MELVANDLSIHGQFQDTSSFCDAFVQLIALRRIARRFGQEIYCHRALLAVEARPGVTLQEALGHLSEDERRAAMVWLTRGGPFWDDRRQHGPGDWLECQGDVVTDTGVGEAAYRTLNGVLCDLVSLAPSHWDFSPVEVIWHRDDGGLDNPSAAVQNWRDCAALNNRLIDMAPPPRSWGGLREASTNRFERLKFANDCFEPLDGVPFASGAAKRFIVLLDVLDRSARAFDVHGRRTKKGQRIYHDYFTGGQAVFSDSSYSEKQDFRRELTFPHPDDPKKSLFCTWHGKVSHMTLRLHYWWSRKSGDPVYIMYIGPKITRR